MTEKYNSYIFNKKIEYGREFSCYSYLTKEADKNIRKYMEKSAAELIKEKEQKEGEENSIFEKIEKLIKEWAKINAEKQMIEAAAEYSTIKKVNHTDNVWKTNEWNYGKIINCSNAVYKMVCRIDKGQKIVLRWFLNLNSPLESIEIAGQKKSFKTIEDMKKYLNGRIKKYSSLFKEEYPPVPKKYAEYFMMHEKLLPGYTIEEE